MTIRRTLAVLFCMTLFAGVLLAHHGRAGYDTKGQGITLRGVVTEYKWINPHVFLNWNVKNEKGETVGIFSVRDILSYLTKKLSTPR